MKFKLEINMENAAFDNTIIELSRCLDSVVNKLCLVKYEDWFNWHKIRDSNGNSVGSWIIINDEEVSHHES